MLMRKALSSNSSLDRGVNSSAFVADRRVTERGHAVIGCSKEVMSVGAFLPVLDEPTDSLYYIRTATGSQWRSMAAAIT